jgi:hypothetical protein
MTPDLDNTIFQLLEERDAYGVEGLLKYDTWRPIAELLNRRGFRTPFDQVPWTSKSLANYYRRKLKAKDSRLKPSITE